MPVDMKVPKKIPVGDPGPMGSLERLEIEFLEDGSAVVSALPRVGGGGGPAGILGGPPKRYAFQDGEKLRTFVNQKIDEAVGGSAGAPPEEGEGLPEEEAAPGEEEEPLPPPPPAAAVAAGPRGAVGARRGPPMPPPEEEELA